MDKYILFGAGQLGKEFISLLGNDRIKFFVDNDKKKLSRRNSDLSY